MVRGQIFVVSHMQGPIASVKAERERVCSTA